MSAADVTEQAASFAVRLLERCGGVVDWPRFDAPGTAVLPAPTARRLGLEEAFALSGQPADGALCVSLASEFLESAVGLLDEAVERVGTFELPDCYLKSGGLEEAAARAFTWHNARVRVREAAPERVEYHTWWFYASLRSEDVWEARLAVTLNSVSGAPLNGWPDMLESPDLQPCEPAGPPPDTYAAAARLAGGRLLHEAAPFLARLEARLARDVKRLRDYYGALKREAAGPQRRTAQPPSDEEIADRKRVVDLELQRKLGELRERYEIDARVEPLVQVRLLAPALRVDLNVQRKQAQRTHTIYWSPLTKQFEPIRCTRCGEGTYSVAFTNDEVAPECANCSAAAERARPAER